MTNREKYKFDDFTLENYERLVKLAVEKDFTFISYTDDFVSGRKDVLWRHDVEFEPDVALKMAQSEAGVGVKATYFFQLHCPYYNVVDSHYRNVFDQIRDLGHYVGLHFDSHFYGVQDEDQLNEYIVLDKEYFEKVLKVKIDTFSFHNTTPFTQSCMKKEYGGLINVYSAHFKQNFNYCGDSLGYWRFDRLEDVLNDASVRHLQVLTHDANWSEDVLSPRDRVHKFVYDHAERLYKQQVDGLHVKGMKCPSNVED